MLLCRKLLRYFPWIGLNLPEFPNKPVVVASPPIMAPLYLLCTNTTAKNLFVR